MENPQASGSTNLLIPPASWCHPSSRVYRFMALILICFLCFGSYFCYDTPAALADKWKKDSQLNTSQFALLYSIYSWPNVILCCVGGYLTDRYFGVRCGSIIFMTLVFIGAALFACGVYINAFWLMILGRCIFGIGGESTQMATNSYMVLWFKGHELNMVFGLQFSVGRIATTVNFWVMEPIYKWVANYYVGYERLGAVVFIASLTGLGALICGLIMGWLDYRAEKILNRKEENAKNEPIHLVDIIHFTPAYWLTTVICVVYYTAIIPFVALAKLFFERKYNLSPEDANTVNSMVYLLSAGLTPCFGIIIDKTGRNIIWIIVSIVCTIGSHSILAFTFFNPYIGVVLLGISYSLFCSGFWPLIALIIPEKQVGTAYGICLAIQNLGIATTVILAEMICYHYGYLMLEIFFLACLFVSLIAALLIYIMDSANKGVYTVSPNKTEPVKE